MIVALGMFCSAFYMLLCRCYFLACSLCPYYDPLVFLRKEGLLGYAGARQRTAERGGGGALAMTLEPGDGDDVSESSSGSLIVVIVFNNSHNSITIIIVIKVAIVRIVIIVIIVIIVVIVIISWAWLQLVVQSVESCHCSKMISIRRSLCVWRLYHCNVALLVPQTHADSHTKGHVWSRQPAKAPEAHFRPHVAVES